MPGKPGAKPKEKLDPRHITLRDLKRAKNMLGGKDPMELMNDPLEAMTLTAWCLLSRTKPDMKLEDAEDVALDDFEQPPGDLPPAAAEPPTSTG